jgi:hypothetical protein
MATNSDKQHSRLAGSIMNVRTMAYNLWFTLCHAPAGQPDIV